MAQNNDNRRLLAELGRRGVYQAVGVYVAAGWVVTEILIAVTERLGWPAWLADAALVCFLTALPFVVLLAWSFDLTGSGLKRVDPASLGGKVLVAGSMTLVLGLSAAWLLLKPKTEPEAAVPAIPVSERPVIAVMPFEDYALTETSPVVARAFTEELIHRINAHPDLVALNLGSVTRAAGAEDARSLLPADFFLQGSFRPAPVGWEFNVRLVSQDGVVRWTHKAVQDYSDFSRALDEQAYVAGEVVAALGKSLSGVDYCATSENAEANALYQEAQQRFERRGAVNLSAAARALERATTLDPGFARAWDRLAIVYERFRGGMREDPGAYDMTAEEMIAFIQSAPEAAAARKALDLCPNLGASYVALELSAPVHHAHADLVDFIQEALRRDPGATSLMDRAVYTYLKFGQIERARMMAREHMIREPLSPRSPFLMAWVMRAEGDYAGALSQLEDHQALFGEPIPPLFASLSLAYERLMSDNLSPFDEELPPLEDVELPEFMVEPRLAAAARVDPDARRRLLEQAEVAVTENPANYMGLVGINGGKPWLFALEDEALAWEWFERFVSAAEAGGASGAISDGVWHEPWRRWFGNQRLVDAMNRYTDEHVVFWNRHGPPDDCSWDGEHLACDWPPSAPGLKDLANASYRGLIDVEGSITLTDGRWQGEPWYEGEASAPSAHLVGTLVEQGDLDDDGRTESVNLVNYSTGGTGQLLHLAVSRFDEVGVDNFATAFLGDRVMVRDLRIEGDRIIADLVQAGPNDGACCPGDVVTRTWRLQEGELRELTSDEEPERLSVEILTGTQWELSAWGFDEPVENGITITLEYSDGRFNGRSVCNRYFASVNEAGDIAGGISVTGVGGTRMACAEDHLATAEARFFQALEQVNRVSFMAGALLLTWGQGDDFGSLYFRRLEP